MDINVYKTIVFDCDGVILNSNKAKTDAFYQVALTYGEPAATSLVDYHLLNGGVSRYQKFEYFFQCILEKEPEPAELEIVLGRFAEEVRAALMSCELTPRLEVLRERTRGASWMVVSGGDQGELEEIFVERNISNYFDGGIFGSPDAKEDILEREIGNGRIVKPAIYLGDSKYDHEVAIQSGLDFVFISSWSEFRDWENYMAENSISSVSKLEDIITYF